MEKNALRYAAQLKENIDAIIAQAIVLPEEVSCWKPSDESWSVLEILCHVEEGITYWLGELVEVTQSPGREWGRTMAHPERLQAVAQASTRQTADVLRAIEGLKQEVSDTFGSIRDEQLLIESPHCNPKFGTRPMTFLVEHFLIEHLAKHAEQIARNRSLYLNKHSKELR